MIDKTKMGQNDIHGIVSAKYNTITFYTAKGEKLFTRPAWPFGQHRNWKLPQGDTPPGSYKVGIIYTQVRGRDSRAICDAYGPFCIDLIDLEGQETAYGRGGISIHAGGTGLPDPWADYQALLNTLGCIRVHTKDLVDDIVPLIRRTHKKGGVVYVSVVDRK